LPPPPPLLPLDRDGWEGGRGSRLGRKWTRLRYAALRPLPLLRLEMVEAPSLERG